MVSRQLLLRRLRDNVLLQIAPATHTTHAATTTTVRVRVGLLPLSLLEQIFQQNVFLKKRVEIFKIIKNFVHNLAAPAPAANGGNKRLV